jgi:hypothetical protein
VTEIECDAEFIHARNPCGLRSWLLYALR